MGNLLPLPGLPDLLGLNSHPESPAASPALEARLKQLEELLSQRLQSDESSSRALTQHSRALKRAPSNSKEEHAASTNLLDTLLELLPEAAKLAPLLAL